MLRTRIAILAMTTALASGAFAQSATTPATDTPSVAAASDSTPFVTDQSTSEYRASKFVGLDVYGSDNQKIGDIKDILMDGAGAARTVVIGVGGFLGIGEKNVAVPFASLEWVNARPAASAPSGGATTMRPTGDVTGSTVPSRSPAEQAAYNGYPDHAMVKLSKADLQNAPTFKYYSDTHSSSGAASNATTQPLATAPKP